MDYSKISLKDLACLIHTALQEGGIQATLVGGACVTIYSENRYQSFDLDFVTYDELRKIAQVLEPLKFRQVGRHFYRDDCPYFLDFVNPPIAIGQQPVTAFQVLKGAVGSLQLLTATDCVKDRLASYFHWNDKQAMEQAILVATQQPVNFEDIKQWAVKEGHYDKFLEFHSHLPA